MPTERTTPRDVSTPSTDAPHLSQRYDPVHEAATSEASRRAVESSQRIAQQSQQYDQVHQVSTTLGPATFTERQPPSDTRGPQSRTEAPEPSSSLHSSQRDARNTTNPSSSSQRYTAFELKSPGGTKHDLPLDHTAMAPDRFTYRAIGDFLKSKEHLHPGGDTTQAMRSENQRLTGPDITHLKNGIQKSAKGWTGKFK